MTHETITLDIPQHWTEIQDHIYYKNHSGGTLGEPRDVMNGRLEAASRTFEGCLNHAWGFMEKWDRISSLRSDLTPHRLRRLNDSPPPNIEEKIQMLLELFNQQLRQWDFHKTFTDLMSYFLGVEKLRQQAGYKSGCPGGKLFLREIFELIHVIDLAIAKMDFTLAEFYSPFYQRILETTLTSSEKANKFFEEHWRQHRDAEKAKRRYGTQKSVGATKTKQAPVKGSPRTKPSALPRQKMVFALLEK